MTKYLTVNQVAQRIGLSSRAVRRLCLNDKIPGAQLLSKVWLIPIKSLDRIPVRSPGRPGIPPSTKSGQVDNQGAEHTESIEPDNPLPEPGQ